MDRRNFLKSCAAVPLAGTGAARAEDPKAWYPDAGLGLFLHWGIASLAEVELSWGFFKDVGGKDPHPAWPPEKYMALAGRFNPRNYDPDKWLRAAAQAGFKYAVLTTRHHDGYALWPSEYGNFGVKQHMGGRDLVGPYVEACRRNGLRVGFYYSPGNWLFNPKGWPWLGFPLRDDKFLHRRPERSENAPRYADVPMSEFQKHFETLYAYVKGQVGELLTRYGKIDLLWWDGYDWPIGVEHHPQEMESYVRSLQPGIVMNDRYMIWDSGLMWGDFRTEFEGRRPNTRPRGLWEHSDTMCGGMWGYAGPKAACKSSSYVLTQLVRDRAWGANFMPNFGPRPDGTMQPEFYRVCEELAAWMKHSGVSVHDVQAGPYPEQCDAPVTVSGSTWYVHFLPGERRVAKLAGVKQPRSARLLATGQPVSWSAEGNRYALSLPEQAPADTVATVAVSF